MPEEVNRDQLNEPHGSHGNPCDKRNVARYLPHVVQGQEDTFVTIKLRYLKGTVTQATARAPVGDNSTTEFACPTLNGQFWSARE